MPLQILQTPRADPILLLPAERLRHRPEELLRAGDGHVRAQPRLALQHRLVDPLGQLRAFFLEAPVREHHDAVVVLAAEHAPEALRGVPHGVEGEEVVFADAVGFAQELEAGFQDAGFGVLEGDADAEHGAAVVVVEVDALADFASSDAEQDCAAAVATCGAVGFEGEGGLLGVRGFDKDEFEFPDFVESAHTLPHADDGFHVEVGGKEDDDAVGGDFGEFHKEGAVVTDDTRFIADLETGGNGGLVRAAGYDHGEKGAAGEGHTIGFLDDGGEAEHFGIHFQGRDGSGGDDDGAEAVEDGFDGDGGIKAGEM